MQANSPSLRRGASTLAALALVLGATGVRADTPPSQSDAFPLFDNYIKIGAQEASISGNEAAFQAVTQQPKSGSGGIEDFHFGKDVDKTTTLTIDGRAMAPSEDYLGKLNITKADVGSFEMGYKTFRTYYDGVGGFFPLANTWMPLSAQDLHVDRGQFWAEAKINFPNQPEFTLRYSNETRTGKKDSTIWGSSDFTGLSVNNPPITDYRKLVPSYLDLNERHETVEATLKHTVGNTTVQASVISETVTNNDARYVTNFPGEVIPWAIARLPSASQPAAKALVYPANWNNQTVTVQTDGIDGKTFTAVANSTTVFSEKIKLLAGISYQDVNNDFTGDRPISTSPPTAVGVVVATGNTNLNLMGNSSSKISTGVVALALDPTPDLALKVSLRGQDNATRSDATLTSVAAAVNTTTGGVTITSTNQQEYSRVKETSWAPVPDFTSSGFSSVTIYGSATKRMADGDKHYVTPYTVGTVPSNSALNFEDPKEDHAYYKLGANWRQSALFSLRAEVFYKDNITRASGYGIDLGDYYNLASQFHGLKLTAIVKPSAEVTFTTRYIYQKGKMQVTGLLPTFPEYDSCDAESDTISETIDWIPSTQFYLQANANLVFSYINTVYPRAGTVAAAGATPAWDANGVLQNSNNNNFTGSLLAGFVLTKQDDLQFQVTYYRADNGDAYLAPLTMPYGAAARQYSASAGVKHKFTDRLIGNAKVGYFDSVNDTSGGMTNFHGPMGYVSLTLAL